VDAERASAIGIGATGLSTTAVGPIAAPAIGALHVERLELGEEQEE
jgi:hypothetical protein